MNELLRLTKYKIFVRNRADGGIFEAYYCEDYFYVTEGSKAFYCKDVKRKYIIKY